MNHDIPVKVPRVARGPSRPRVAPLAIGLALIGTGVFASLASSRQAREEQGTGLPLLRSRAASATAPALAPVPIPAVAPAAVPGTLPTPAPMTGPAAMPMTMPLPAARPEAGGHVMPGMNPAMPTGSPLAGTGLAASRTASPALIVDLAQARSPIGPNGLPTTVMSDSGSVSTAAVPLASDPTGAAIAAAGGTAAATASDPNRDLNNDEKFAVRAGSRDVPSSTAQRLRNQNTLVAQGTIIGAVMETALNSDLPGYARALVSRDVLSFDGSRVVIPAGSRVIGEYKSGVAQGASRIFIVWNRLIRPDGVSVSLGSPAVDDLGRGGLGGSVNRHFFERFGGAILTSVLSGGLNILASSVRNGSTVVVSNSSEASALATQASKGSDIPPTIKTRNGAAVRIFVARDLDFSGV